MTTDEPRDLSDHLGRIPRLTDTDRQRARLAVCARAHDTEDARHLLDALGLTETP